MIRKYVFPLLAFCGLWLGVSTAFSSVVVPPSADPIVTPAKSPFPLFIAGSGIIEAKSENIAVAANRGGIVKSVHVSIGENVVPGQVLFQIDDREALSAAKVKSSALLVARSQAEEAARLFSLWEKIPDKRAISEESYLSRQFQLETARANVELRNAELDAAKTELDLLAVRSPIAGQVFQIKTRVGEFAAAGERAQPLMLLGDVSTLHVRVDIDEADAWRVIAKPRAQAFVRGNTELSTPAEFVRVEPYVVPKRNLTGESTERVDTRVMQLIFALPHPAFPLYVGQLMDIFIETDKS